MRRLIIGGSRPSQGESVVGADPSYLRELAVAEAEEQTKEGMLRAFFSPSTRKRRLGEEWWERMTSARPDRSEFVKPEGAHGRLQLR